ncbi:Ras-related GTP-binding protein A [Porphyridium purpureum]|uniref:Ras-related GTP-binding protein A n=1 Tax=Porphyridium purpureum TaxID=35688 RepID=A0A5J4Z040_PORPP|nr:Ras-related GTP-binding protein A [Porphyridium purpureum]|eukprot:POR8246..scf208_2
MVQDKKKLLLMGKSGAGKTSMRSIVFANYVPRDTERLGATIDVERSHIRFLGDLVLSLWDCGGQDSFMENFVGAQRENVFNGVAVMIYVFDAEFRQDPKDMSYFRMCCESIAAKSPQCRVFCLVHKMDLIHEENRESVFAEQSSAIRRVSHMLPVPAECFSTSIWDETLYRAWSSIVCSLVSNVSTLEANLRALCVACEADEVVLFERATFLVIAQAHTKPHEDVHRFEKISNIIKQFKLSCNKSRSQFESLQLQNESITALIDNFTQYTCVMLITSDRRARPAITTFNVHNVRDYFERLLEQVLD